MIAVNWIVAIIVLIVSMLLIVLFKVTADNLKSGDGNAVSCLDEVTKKDAYRQWLNKTDESDSISCYCEKYSKVNGLSKTYSLDFSEFTTDYEFYLQNLYLDES